MDYKNSITYKIFEDAPELTLIPIEDSDDVYSVGDFLDHCIATSFMDYDGYGHFIKKVNGKKYAILDISFSIDNDEVYYKKEFIGSIFYICNNLSLYEIVWFNK